MTARTRTLYLLSLAELLAMGLWFSASAVSPALSLEWDLSDSGKGWLTMSVQIGFVVGTFFSAFYLKCTIRTVLWALSRCTVTKDNHTTPLTSTNFVANNVVE